MRLLFVCTGNLCRSPVAEGLSQAWLARERASATGSVDILSAGTRAGTGAPMDRRSARALERRGGDPTNMRSRALTAEIASSADLVLTMTREHRRSVLERWPRGLRRTFTLMEAADLIRGVDVADLLQWQPAERVQEIARRLDERRAHRAASAADDIRDPIGRPQSVHDAVADQIAVVLMDLLPVLAPSPRPATPWLAGTRPLSPQNAPQATTPLVVPDA